MDLFAQSVRGSEPRPARHFYYNEENDMERREIFKHMLMASGAGLAGLTPGLSLAQEKKDVQPAKLDMLAGQEGGALNPREAHAYAMGMQAFLYGFYIQTERPTDDKVSNWLPAPKTGNFNITMRNYMPSKEIVEKRYDPPVLKRIA